MRRALVLVLGIIMTLTMAGTALAQSGHFLTGGRNAPTCRDVGTTLECSGKVAGLGGTTFRIEVEASGTAIVQCRNPGGNIAPGQNTTVNLEGDTGDLLTPRNGQYQFTVETDEPEVPNVPTCPNPQWQAEVTDVIFDSPATLTLYENGNISHQIQVPVS